MTNMPKCKYADQGSEKIFFCFPDLPNYCWFQIEFCLRVSPGLTDVSFVERDAAVVAGILEQDLHTG